MKSLLFAKHGTDVVNLSVLMTYAIYQNKQEM